jgi:hypothetical protein
MAYVVSCYDVSSFYSCEGGPAKMREILATISLFDTREKAIVNIIEQIEESIEETDENDEYIKLEEDEVQSIRQELDVSGDYVWNEHDWYKLEYQAIK